MTVLSISLLLQNCSTVALNSCNLSLHTVEKFRICSPEHEAHNKIFAAVPAESACASCITLGLLCLNFAGALLEICIKSFASVELIFHSTLKSICSGRQSLKIIKYIWSSGWICAVNSVKGSQNLTPDFQNDLKFSV